MFDGLKAKIKGLKKAKETIIETKAAINETMGPLNEIAQAVKENEFVSTKNTYAALNIVRRKLENNIFIVGILSSAFFLGFYIYMIISKWDILVNVIVYFALSILLIISTFFDIVLNPNSQKKMNFLEKKHFQFLKRVKKNIVAITKMSIKTFSLIYALIELINYGATKQAIISLSISFGLFIIQLLIYLITYVALKYLNYMLIGFEEDMNSSGAYLLLKNNRIKAYGLDSTRTQRETKIKEEIQAEVEFLKPKRQEDEEIRITYGKYHFYDKDARNLIYTNTFGTHNEEIYQIIDDANKKYKSTHAVTNFDDKTSLIINFLKSYLKGEFKTKEKGTAHHALCYLMYYIKEEGKKDLTEENQSFKEFLLEKMPELKDYRNYILENKTQKQIENK